MAKAVSFCGAGFLGAYHLGATELLANPRAGLICERTILLGASAGSLVAAALATGVPQHRCLDALLDLSHHASSSPLGVLSPSVCLVTMLGGHLDRLLPMDAHHRVEGRLFVAVTVLKPRPTLELATGFTSRDDLIDACLASCAIPYITSKRQTHFRGQRAIDGGIVLNWPRVPAPPEAAASTRSDTITVSPFAGAFDICPPHTPGLLALSAVGAPPQKAPTPAPFRVLVQDESVDATLQNVRAAFDCLRPLSADRLKLLYQAGQADASAFLRRRNAGVSIAPAST